MGQVTTDGGWRLEHSYAALPRMFFEPCVPVPVKAPRLVVFNQPLAQSLGLDVDALDSEACARIFSGNYLPAGSYPLAQAYAGHQFGHFTKLGDGRALLLGEQITPLGQRFDVQLKGAGRTPYSRGGDGRAALGPMLREYIISEAMHALGIASTRSLAVVATGETVQRELPLPGAVLTRVAQSHIRVGTIQWAAANADTVALRALADHTLQRHYPHLQGAPLPYLALFSAVLDKQAALIAQWMHVGFIHGVMNTDNMALCGETIDFGPCAFMDAYDPETVFSSIDRHGRYAYGNQPPMAQWNLSRLAQALLPLLHEDQEQAVELANSAIHSFESIFRRYWLSGMKAKLGLLTDDPEDPDLIEDLLSWMQQHRSDFTNTFCLLSSDGVVSDKSPHAIPPQDGEFQAWLDRWQARLDRQPQPRDTVTATMRAHNPAVIPRNHKVEEALNAVTERGDLSVLQSLLAALEHPYDHSVHRPNYTTPAPASHPPYRTFCGT